MPNYLTLPRQQLYDLVWSKRMMQVAAEFGISDVALARWRNADGKLPLKLVSSAPVVDEWAGPDDD